MVFVKLTKILLPRLCIRKIKRLIFLIEEIKQTINLGFTQNRLKNYKCFVQLTLLNYKCKDLTEYLKNSVLVASHLLHLSGDAAARSDFLVGRKY
jgi:hypothetical protein